MKETLWLPLPTPPSSPLHGENLVTEVPLFSALPPTGQNAPSDLLVQVLCAVVQGWVWERRKRLEFVSTPWAACSRPQSCLSCLGNRRPGVISRVLSRVKHGRSELTPEPTWNPDTASGFYVFTLVLGPLPLENKSPVRVLDGCEPLGRERIRRRGTGRPLSRPFSLKWAGCSGNCRFLSFLTGWGAGPRCC